MKIPLHLSVEFLQESYASGALTPREVVTEIEARILARGEDAVWIHRTSLAENLFLVEQLEERKKNGAVLPLYGIPFAIKDNIDWAGHPTTAGCPAFAYKPARSAVVVEQLLAVGAIPVGKTNLDQFATGLVGVRSPYGIPRSVYHRDYISGGSSSGSAVAVAAGLVSFSLGTDTAGSGRVPAAFNGIVGLKPTRGRWSTSGVVPACRTLDCVSVFGLDVRDAGMVGRVLDGTNTSDETYKAHQLVRFGVPRMEQREFFRDEEAARLYREEIQRRCAAGWQKVEIDYEPFLETARLLYAGPWVAERMAAIEPFYREHREEIHPVVREIIGGAEKWSAVDAFRGLYRLEELRQQTAPVWEQIEVLLLPTTGTTYTVAEVEADPIRLNSNLGYYTNFVNLLDLCALAIPAGTRANGLPFGVTLMAPAGRDEQLLRLATENTEG